MVFDVGGETFRKRMYAEYKANRQEQPEDLRAQIPLCIESAGALGMPRIQVPGVEADDAWKAKPVLARNKEEVLATAGSRYTYCANPLALRDAKEAGVDRLALVGMGCQVSSPPTMWDRKAGKVSKPFLFNIGLLCSKTFDDAIFPELFEAKYGLKKQDMVKMNIKGVFQIWMKDGSYHEIDLKECHQWTREGCKHCPDFAAEHADISTGGIGAFNDWTLAFAGSIAGMLSTRSRDSTPPGLSDGAIAALKTFRLGERVTLAGRTGAIAGSGLFDLSRLFGKSDADNRQFLQAPRFVARIDALAASKKS